jgi:hypothetical protein
VIILPKLSAATQKPDVGQEMAPTILEPSIVVEVQLPAPPVGLVAVRTPPVSVTAQKVALVQTISCVLFVLTTKGVAQVLAGLVELEN